MLNATKVGKAWQNPNLICIMSRQIHIPNFKSISQMTAEESLENRIWSKGNNSRKSPSSMTKLKLDLYYVMTNPYTKFKVNISKDDRQFRKTELWRTDRQTASKLRVPPGKPVENLYESSTSNGSKVATITVFWNVGHRSRSRSKGHRPPCHLKGFHFFINWVLCQIWSLYLLWFKSYGQH